MALPRDFGLAIKIAEKVFNLLPEFLNPGLTEKEIARSIRYYLKHHGAKKESFRIIVASGKRSAMIHGFASEKKIKENEVVMFDFGALHKGYRSDITRTYVLGKPDKLQKRIYSILLKAQKAAIKKVKAGAVCRDIDLAARDVIKKAGYGKNFIHSTGHGICFKTHEPPHIHHKNEKLVYEGDVITIEPGIYLNGKWGMRLEDMVQVTKKGCKILTSVPHNLELKP